MNENPNRGFLYFMKVTEVAFTLSEISEPMLHSGNYETSLKYSEEGIAMGTEKAIEYAMDFEKD